MDEDEYKRAGEKLAVVLFVCLASVMTALTVALIWAIYLGMAWLTSL